MLKLSLSLTAIFVCVVSILFCLKPDQITYRSFEQIREGMSESEVERILLVPAGIFPKRRVHVVYKTICFEPPQGGKAWVGDDFAIYLWFDHNGCVLDKRFGVVTDGKGHLITRVLFSLGIPAWPE